MNSFLIKTTNCVVCSKCNEIKHGKDMKYVKFIFSLNCFALCSECRDKYLNGKLMRFLIKPCE